MTILVPATGDQSLLKQINRMALVRAVQRTPGLSRADLAKASGLTKSTVSLLTQELIEEGWLLEQQAAVTGALGRRPTPLRLDGSRSALLGAEIGVEGLAAVAVSLTGEVIETASETYAPVQPQPTLEHLAELIDRLLASMKNRRRRVLGVGVGVPGAVDARKGALKVAPNLGWRDVELVAALRRLLGRSVSGLEIRMQNEADVAAVGEFEFSEHPVAEPLIFLSLGVGVGAGIVANDRLFRGADGFAGEIGHSVLEIEGPRCSCGRRGCAEAFIGLRAIAKDAAPGALRSVPEIAKAAGRAQSRAQAAVRRAGEYLGVLVQNLCAAFNPGCLVFGGPACELGKPFLESAYQRIESYAAEADMPIPELRLARFGPLAVPVGAAALVLHTELRPH